MFSEKRNLVHVKNKQERIKLFPVCFYMGFVYQYVDSREQ